MKKLSGWCRAHRGGLAALAGGGAALGVFAAARSSRTAMDWWLAHISMPVKRGISFAVGPLPFSACELGATVLCLGALAMLVRAVRRRRLADWALHIAVLLVWGYAGVCALWGTQYYGTGFAEKAGMTAPPVSAKALAAVTDWFAEKVNETAPLTERDANGLFAADKAGIFAGCSGLYDPLDDRRILRRDLQPTLGQFLGDDAHAGALNIGGQVMLRGHVRSSFGPVSPMAA